MNEILILIAVVIGYYLGRNRSVKEDIKTISRELPRLPRQEVKPGIIQRPSSQDLYARQMNTDQKEALRETLQNTPEIEEARVKVQELKERGLI